MKDYRLIAAYYALEAYRRANIRKNGIEAIAEQTDKYLIIAFRGTNSIGDWLRNLQTNHLIYPWDKDYKGDVRVHAGIAKGYLGVRDAVHAYVRSCNRPVIVTGHSKGGMLADVGGVDIQYNFDRRVIVVTFGAPAVGNQAFADSANNRIDHLNYRNSFDLMPYFLFKNKHISLHNLNNYFYPFHSMSSYNKSIKWKIA